ncbi:unnamed protein product, partial [Meganyctiphanes norvegica]
MKLYGLVPHMAWQPASHTQASLCGLMMRWINNWKVLRCYILILGWLAILLLALSYWRIESSSERVSVPAPVGASSNNDRSVIGGDGPGTPSQQHNRHRFKKIRNYCNPPDRISANQEGTVLDDGQYRMSGAVLLFRHGDRGPLISVKNISSINCGRGAVNTSQYKKYVHDILNVSKTNAYECKQGGASYMRVHLLIRKIRRSYNCLMRAAKRQTLLLPTAMPKRGANQFKFRPTGVVAEDNSAKRQTLLLPTARFGRPHWFRWTKPVQISRYRDIQSSATRQKRRAQDVSVSACDEHCSSNSLPRFPTMVVVDTKGYRTGYNPILHLHRRDMALPN